MLPWTTETNNLPLKRLLICAPILFGACGAPDINASGHDAGSDASEADVQDGMETTGDEPSVGDSTGSTSEGAEASTTSAESESSSSTEVTSTVSDTGTAETDETSETGEDGSTESDTEGDDDHPNLRSLVAGHRHACTFNDEHEVICFGDGRGTYVPRSDAFPGPNLGLAAGQDWSCTLGTYANGGPQWLGCWGIEERLQELKGTEQDPYVELSGSHATLCLRRQSGQVECLQFGESDQDEWADTPGETFRTVDAGRDHACGVREDRTVACWGSRTWEQLDATPPPAGEFLTVSSGSDYDCGITVAGELRCWSRFDHHPVLNNVPDQLGRLKEIAAVHAMFCALAEDNQLDCWTTNDPGPQGLPSANEFQLSQLSAAHDFVCAVNDGGANQVGSQCWQTSP